jgi:integrase
MKDCSVKGNKARQFFITLETARAVLDVMVDQAEQPLPQWQLIFALARLGALRCPSEISLLTWQDVDFEQGKLTIHSPKTEAYDGKDKRVMPLFPELRPFLEATFNEAEQELGRPPSPTDHVVASSYRGEGKNLGTQLKRFLRRAGIEPWPKIFHNLRSSRATELTKIYPDWMVAQWCGHDPKVAKEHYWQITDADWERAAIELTDRDHPFLPGQKTGQKWPENGPKLESSTGPEICKSLPRNDLQDSSVTPTGLEPVLPA